MDNVIVQYVLVVVLILGLSYLVYLLKDKGVYIKEDYYGIAYTILNALEDKEGTPENIKKILRLISQQVKFVEVNYKSEDNELKEEKALILVKESLEELGLKSKIEEESLRHIIRLSSALMPGTNKNM